MSTTKTRMTLEVARTVAAGLIAKLSPVCERIAVAGSVRRGNVPDVGDIELVCIPKVVETNIPGQMDLFGGAAASTVQRASRLDDTLEMAVRAGEIHNRAPFGIDTPHAWGEKYKKFWVRVSGGYAQVDLFVTTPDAWGAIFTIRTGPWEFRRALMRHFNTRTPYRQQDGGLTHAETGAIMPTPEEADYFRAAGLPYIAPEQRTAAAVQMLARRAVFQTGGKGAPEPSAGERTTPAPVAPSRYTIDDTDVRKYIRTRLERAAGLVPDLAELLPVWRAGLYGYCDPISSF